MSMVEDQVREAVVWAYRLILGREPENDDVVSHHAARENSIEGVRETFLKCSESRVGAADRAMGGVLAKFLPPWRGAGEKGFLTDFLGVKTRCSYLPNAYASLSGIVDGPPTEANAHFHSLSEWKATLLAVMEAKDNRFVIIELGAGWGPWIVSGASAARKLGIENIVMAGIEGSAEHFAFLRQHLLDNGFKPEDHILMHAVVGAADGIAKFPKLRSPSEEWGASADFSDAFPKGEMDEVKCVALGGILSQLPTVDLIHCDIQGAEAEVLAAARDALNERVKRIVIGTHSRSIEVSLLDLFSSAGWRLETDERCELTQLADGKCVLARDGVQVWRNTAL